MLDQFALNIPLKASEAFYHIGVLAEKMPYLKGENIAGKQMCEDIALKLQDTIVHVKIPAVNFLVACVDVERAKGNDTAVKEIDQLISILKGGVDRKIIGAFLRGLNNPKNFKEDDEGNLQTKIVIPRVKG